MDCVKKFLKSYRTVIRELINLNLIVSRVKIIEWASITFSGHWAQLSERESSKKMLLALRHRCVVSHLIKGGNSGINTLCGALKELYTSISTLAQKFVLPPLNNELALKIRNLNPFILKNPQIFSAKKP